MEVYDNRNCTACGEHTRNHTAATDWLDDRLHSRRRNDGAADVAADRCIHHGDDIDLHSDISMVLSALRWSGEDRKHHQDEADEEVPAHVAELL